MWKIIGNQMAFTIDDEGYVVNNACYMMTGEHLDYILAFLNSKAILWYSYVTNMNKTGAGDVQVGGQNVAIIPIPPYDRRNDVCVRLAECASVCTQSKEAEIDALVGRMLNLSEAEMDFLDNFAKTTCNVAP